ncbi:MAG: HAD family hydrolase [Spirochaetaceae bacterium]|nr:MAG: HAD family hydrolase [Spirochaetaceae bacterium]
MRRFFGARIGTCACLDAEGRPEYRSRMAFHAVLFDLDGTLLDTLADIAVSMNHALQSLGFPAHEVDSYRRRVGWGARVLAEKSLPEDHHDPDTVARCVQLFAEYYSLHPNDHTRPFEGIVQMLAALRTASVPCAVLSNKPHDLTVSVVAQSLEGHPFVAVYGDRSGVPPKPHPGTARDAARQLGHAEDEVLFVGDSDIDMQTAVAAGMEPVGVTWGFRTREVLHDAGARVIIDQPAQLLNLLEKTNGHQ